MREFLKTSCFVKWLTSTAIAVSLGGFAGAQDFGRNLPGGDLSGMVGTQYFLDGIPALLDESEGFFYGLGVSASYNSNLFLDETGEVDDIILSVNPWIRYQTAAPGSARAVASVSASAGYNRYLDNSSLDGLNPSVSGSLQLNGARSSATARVAYSRSSSSDRNAGSFTESKVFAASLSGNYEVSPKTSVAASWGLSNSSYDRIGSSDSESYHGQITGWWQATPLVRLGPSLRHTESTSDNSGDREAWALLMRMSYAFSSKVSLSASGGIEWQEFSGTGGATSDGTQFTGDLNATWNMDELWSFGFSMFYRNTPSLNTTNYYINNFGTGLTATRNLTKGSLRAGLNYNNSGYEQSGPVVTPRGDESYWSIFGAYNRPLFRDALQFNSSIRFSENSGLEDWSNVQLSAGLNYVF